MSERARWFPSLGSRVLIAGRNDQAGCAGTITNSPGKVFNGWTVRLDSGHYIGAGERDLRSANIQPGSEQA